MRGDEPPRYSSVGVYPQQRNNAVVVARRSRSNLSAEKGEKF